MTALMIILSASAQDYIEGWYYDDYPDEEAVDGYQAWVSGYSGDEWYGYQDGEIPLVYSLSDDNGGSFGSGDAADNWLVYEDASWNDAMFKTVFYSEDDDALGLVFHFQDDENYYMFLMSQDSTPVSVGSDSFMALVKVEDGDATVLESEREDYRLDSLNTIAIEYNDGTITVSYWEDDDSDGSPDVSFSAEDDSFEGGALGFYSYDCGYEGGWSNSNLAFGAAEVLAIDDDEDGVIDDDDNCEFVENSDQADEDGDGIGDLCDDDYSSDNGGGGDNNGGGGDNNNGGGGSDTGGAENELNSDGEVKLGGSCSVVAAPAGLLAALLPLLVVFRRRR
ncbi:MAG: hypothetical protein P8R54_09495 [Myxococcota bacterium]|nr:hypothetical protein [Myxococcota bacterium]